MSSWPTSSEPAWLSSAAWFAVASKATATGGREDVDTLVAWLLGPASRLTCGAGLQEQGTRKFRNEIELRVALIYLFKRRRCAEFTSSDEEGDARRLPVVSAIG